MDFRNQILEDIEEYKKLYPNIRNIEKNEWAFNFWVLDKFFGIDEELIELNIVDYKDMGIDCFAYFEDTREFYIIQNKFYSDSTPLSRSYVEDDFLIRPINSLKEGTFRKSTELQKAFTKYKDDPNFTVYLQIYVTNNNVNDSVYESVRNFNKNHFDEHIKAEIITLDDIQEKYYGEPLGNKVSFEYTLNTINNGTSLNVDTDNYPFDLPLKARYVLTPVVTLYRMYREAREKTYPLFDANIREYLGNKGINKSIYDTLMNESDRRNFFYYNNGITIVCEHMSSSKTTPEGLKFSVSNPQVVNGCQTVSTIYEALNDSNPNSLEKDFKDTFVLVKILQVDDSIEQKELYKNIVTYNNSQNAIDQKTFVANSSEFVRLQKELEQKGFLLLIKQSDKNKYSNKYKSVTELANRNNDLVSKYDLNFKNVSDYMIKLDKLLQVILAFSKGATQAYQKKGNLLKVNTEQYNAVMDFIKSNEVTTNTIINMYLLYLKLFTQKKDTENGDFPIPYYALDCFNKYDCREDITSIMNQLSNKENINKLFKIYYITTFNYTKNYTKEHNIGYNTMIKQNVDYSKLEDCYAAAKEMINLDI